MRRLAVVAAAVAVVLALAGCEPSMTISARNSDGTVIYCEGSAHIVGVVSPHTATGAVQLQRTVGGKWKDVSGFGSMTDFTQQYITGAKASPRRAAVNQSTGAYAINYYPATETTETPLHFRVRSDGGGSFSPGFYLTKEFC